MNTLRTYMTRTRERRMQQVVAAHHAKHELARRHQADRLSARPTVEALHPTPSAFLTLR